MALANDLKTYIAAHGRSGPPAVAGSRVVIVGEYHGEVDISRLRASVRLLRELLRDARYRFFGNESFLNAGPIRQGVQDYWRRGRLPPPFNPHDVHLRREEKGKRLFTHAFKPLLDDLQVNQRAILHIGTRTKGENRDWPIARHFFEELVDHGATPRTPGVLLLGARHAAAVPFRSGQTPTRMHLERKGFDCVSILLLTDFIHKDGSVDDLVVATGGSASPGIRLTSLPAQSVVSMFTGHPLGAGQPSPLRSVRLDSSDSGKTLAEQFEFLVLARI